MIDEHTAPTARSTPALSATTYDSPVGALTLVASDAGLRAILWPDDHRDLRGVSMVGDPDRQDDAPSETPAAAHLRRARAWLDHYFTGATAAGSGELDGGNDVGPPPPVDLDLVGTPFQRAVWEALTSIEPGETVTYGALAERLGRPGAARAVGAAVGRNPVSIVIGCHRVIGASGTLTGFAGGLDTKRWLLRHEAGAGVAGARRQPTLSTSRGTES